MKLLLLFGLALSLKLAIEIETLKSKQIYSVFSPNQVDPLELHHSAEPTAFLKLKLEDSQGDLVSASQVILALNGPKRYSFPFPKQGPLYRYELNAKSLLDGDYEATVYVSDPKLDNIEYPFARFKIVSGNPVEEDDFLPKKELFHTFRPEVPEVDGLIPNVFVALTLSPWIILFALWIYLGVNISNFTSSLKTIVTSSIFLITLALSLLLFHSFWVKLNLFQLFSYGVPIWTLTAVAGRFALQSRAMNGLKSN